MAKFSSWLKWTRDGRVELLLAGGGGVPVAFSGVVGCRTRSGAVVGVACQCRSRKPLAVKLFPMLCVILYFYPATCGPKGHGSGSAAAYCSDGSCF